MQMYTMHLETLFMLSHLCHLRIPSLADKLCQYILTSYTHVHLWTILMPIKCYVTVTNILIWQLYLFFHIFDHLCILWLKDILPEMTFWMYLCTYIFYFIYLFFYLFKICFKISISATLHGVQWLCTYTTYKNKKKSFSYVKLLIINYIYIIICRY